MMCTHVCRGIFEAIEAHCKRKSGYTALVDVRRVCSHGERGHCFHSAGNDGSSDETPPERGDPEIGQPSYFLAETLKYLLLMFGSPERMQLDEIVFTTEGVSDGIEFMPVAAIDPATYLIPGLRDLHQFSS